MMMPTSALLARFERDVSAIAVNWIVFGSGGQAVYRAQPVTEPFTDALPPEARESRTIKAIGRRSCLAGTGIHRVTAAEGRYVMPSGREAVFDGLTADVVEPDVAVAALHHYAVKSLEEFEEKRVRGHANSQNPEVKRARLDARFAEFDAGGVLNPDLARYSLDLLMPKNIKIDGINISERVLVMLDDVHNLSSFPRNYLVTSII